MSGYTVTRMGSILTVENSTYSQSFPSHAIRYVTLSRLMMRVEIKLVGETDTHKFGEYHPEALVALRDAIVSAWNECLQSEGAAATAEPKT